MRKYLQFIVSRLLGTAVDTGVLWVISKYLFGNYFGTYILGPIISFEFAVMSNFLCSYYWIWSSRVERKDGRSFWHHFWVFNLSSIAGFLVKMVFLLLFERIFGWGVVVCNLVALLISGVLNYFLAESIVFRKRYRRPEHEIISFEELTNVSVLLRGPWGRSIARWLLRLCGVDRLNRLYDSIFDYSGKDSATQALSVMGVDYLVGNAERLEELPKGPFITISNHPYGGLDGVVLIDLFGTLREDYKVMVNDILSRVEPMRDVFIAVTPTGTERKATTVVTLSGIKRVVCELKEGHPIGFFPSGAVSDLHLSNGTIADRPWQQSLVHLIKKANVPIVPVRFFDRNSMFYYFLGVISWKIRILRLPRELFNKHRGVHRIGIGRTISVAEQAAFPDPKSLTDFLRESVYSMEMPEKFVRRSELKKKGEQSL